jgi:hypothetical protein
MSKIWRFENAEFLCRSFVGLCAVAHKLSATFGCVDRSFTILRMAFPRVLGHLEAAQWVFHSQANCEHCGKAIEWWSVPGNRRRAYDPMLKLSSPVVPHRCHSHHEPSQQSLKRHAANW